MGARVRPRPEAGAPARLPQGSRATLAREAALRRRRAARSGRAPHPGRLPAGPHRGAARSRQRARPAGGQARGERAAVLRRRRGSQAGHRAADYKSVEVQHAPAAVSDDEAAAALEQMREQQAEFRAVDRAAASGDLAVVDYTLRPDEHDATTANGYHFVIGSGAVMPEIDAAAVGMKAGDQKDVALRFPDDHRLESLRGKGGTATLKVSEVKEKILPALDDEFAKSLGEFATLDALRAEVRKQLETRREAEQRRELEDKIVGAVLQHHEFTVPDALVMRQIAHPVEHARERLRRQGV